MLSAGSPAAVDQLLAPVEGPAADDELAAFAKAIGHPTRVRILRMLARQEAHMCSHIVDELPLAQSTVSEHHAQELAADRAILLNRVHFLRPR